MANLSSSLIGRFRRGPRCAGHTVMTHARPTGAVRHVAPVRISIGGL